MTYLYKNTTVLWSILRECIGIQMSPGSCKTSQGNCWAVGEDQDQKLKIELDIPLQEPNRFINGFMEHP